MTMPPLTGVFLASKDLHVVNYPSYSADLSIRLLIISKAKKMLSATQYTSRRSLGSNIYQCLNITAFQDWVKRLQK